MAKLTFYGATEGVTGSAYLLKTRKSTVLLECGLVQGGFKKEKANEKPFPFQVSNIDAVVLSHAHLDHSGRTPKLVKEGYDGPVFATRPTCELLEIMFRDAASLEMRDTEWINKRRRRAGKAEIDPLYTLEDAEAALTQCVGIAYGHRYPVAEDVEVCFQDAGHILGSAIVELYVTEDGSEKKLVFSGDLGNSFAALLRDPVSVTEADVLLLESTYGDREHKPMDQTLDEFESIVVEASKTGGNILIPSFAVGRTQEIIFRLGELFQEGKIHQQAVYLDSPMAIATTEVYHRHQAVFSDEDGEQLRSKSKQRVGKDGRARGSLHTFLPVLRYTRTTEESMDLNKLSHGAIIIAGSGMCNGGRIRHHLKHNLWRSDAHVIIVGYQAHGTPGRALVDGAERIRMGDQSVAVKASIHTLGGFSAHASQSQLINWANNFSQPRPRLYLIHGESGAKETLRNRMGEQGWSAEIPSGGQSIEF